MKGGKSVYKTAVIILVIGSILGGTQYFASMALRGSATPANMKFYINLFTLGLFIILGLPGIKDKVDFSGAGGDADKTAGGMTAIISGMIALTVFKWVGSTHTYQGENWVDLFDIAVIFFGLSMLAIGISIISWVAYKKVQEIRQGLPLKSPKP